MNSVKDKARLVRTCAGSIVLCIALASNTCGCRVSGGVIPTSTELHGIQGRSKLRQLSTQLRSLFRILNVLQKSEYRGVSYPRSCNCFSSSVPVTYLQFRIC